MEIQPIGSGLAKKVAVRVIAATNKNLRQRVNQGQFREDLYFRLAVVPIEIPPLRLRSEDIEPLADFFLHKINAKYSCHKKFDLVVLNYFRGYHWPGNIRELKNVIERMIICTGADTIGVHDLPDSNWEKYLAPAPQGHNGSGMKSTIGQLEKKLILEARQRFPSARQAAQSLGLPLSTFLRKLRRYQGDESLS
jgi:transcriptional regulator with PAS, ATPase and Fis domain